MDEQDQTPERGPAIAASRQGLLDHEVFGVAVRQTRMAMALADPNLPDCPLVYVNPAFSGVTGYAAEEAVGRNCRFLQGPDTDPAAVARIRRTLATREWLEVDIYNYRKDGAGFWNALHLSPIFDGDGRLIYYFASHVDVSHRHEAEGRRRRRAESIDAMAAGVAHTFNNLMTTVVGSVERAGGQPVDERQARHLGRADHAARRAGKLAAELLALAQRRSGDERADDLNEALRQLGSTLAQAAGPAVQVELALAPGALPVRLDAGQLGPVLRSLVRNAADATAGGGQVAVATRALSSAEAASALGGKEAVELSVSDTGSGMTAEVLARATELFFTTKGAADSTGLGLFLALEFVDQAGGKLAIDSAPGRGTTVRMVFPRAT